MKNLIIVLVCLLVPQIGFAEYKFAEKWTWQDTAWQSAFLVLLAADWSQTKYISKHPEDYKELNPLLSKHPSGSEVDTYFAACALGHTLVSLALPPKAEVFGYKINPRRIWQGVWIGIEAGVVTYNASIGIQFGF